MANPLAGLGNLLGGAGTVGASGAGGAFEGLVEGEKLKRVFQSHEIQNQLKELEKLLLGQQLGPQYKTDPHGRILLQVPGHPPQMIGALPPGPSTALQDQQMETSKATQRWHEEQIKHLGQEKGLPPTHVQMFKDWLVKNPGGSYLDFHHQEINKAPKEPASLDALLAKANDPTVPAEERGRAKQQADAIEQARTRIAGANATTHASITEDVKKRAEDRKASKGFASTETLLNQLEKLVPAMEKKGFLAATPDASSAAMAAARRSRYVPMLGKPGDEDLQAWRAHAGTMVAILRQLGDIGPRAIAAYQSAIDVIEHPSTAAGARKVFGQLREALQAAKTGEVGSGDGPAPGGGGGGSAQAFPPLPDPSTMPNQTAKWDPTGEYFRSNGVKWDRVPAPGGRPGAPGAPGARSEGGKRSAVAPDGSEGLLPANTDLSKYPGYRWK